MSDQRKLNAFVRDNPLALVVLSLVIVLVAVAIFVSDATSSGYRAADFGSPFWDYVVAPLLALAGLAGIAVGIRRAGRQGAPDQPRS